MGEICSYFPVSVLSFMDFFILDFFLLQVLASRLVEPGEELTICYTGGAIPDICNFLVTETPFQVLQVAYLLAENIDQCYFHQILDFLVDDSLTSRVKNIKLLIES